jgi:hypothetical protein
VVTLKTQKVGLSEKYLHGVCAAGLAASLVALGLAPAFMPDSYSWVTHTTSESAAQGVEFAWIARLGFVLFGSAVLLLVCVIGRAWNPLARIGHAVFGALMIAAALFSHRPWEAGIAFSQTEDFLHSVAATGMGFGFAAGVIAVALFRRRVSGYVWVIDALALVATVAIPLAMVNLEEYTGLLQRGMFLIAYLWYWREIILLAQSSE